MSLNIQQVKELAITEGDVRTIHDSNGTQLWGYVAYDTKYEGNITQQTYTGKNQFDINTLAKGDITVVDGVATGTAGQFYTRFQNGITLLNTSPVMTITATAYRDGESSSGNGMIFRAVYTDTTFDNILIFPNSSTSATTLTGSTDNTKTLDKIVLIYGSGSSTVWHISNVQVEAGSTATSYEPYVGGIPAPNPDYPQTVNVVTGEQTVTVVGKNLFDKDIPLSRDYVNAAGGWTTSPKNPSFINQWYDSITGGATFQFSFLSRVGSAAIRFAEYNAAGTFIKRTVIDAQTSLTTSVNTAKIIFSIDAYSSRHFNNLQIEIGATATTYEAYKSTDYTVNLGSTELAKIDGYQDYIYKSGSDWYVHKATGNVTLDNNSFTGQTSTISGLQCIITTASTTPNKVSSGSAGTYCNKASMKRSSDPLFAEGCYYENPTNFVFAGSATDTYSDVVGKYSGAVLYYVLATSTDTKITDTSLIDQLEAIHEWLTRYGYNSSVSGNLPLIINQTNLS